MLKTYLKSAFRQLANNRLFSAVNIGGLTIGLASIMVLVAAVYQYFTTDKSLDGLEQMYYLKTASKGKQYPQTTYPLLNAVVSRCPDVEAATHIQQWYYPWLKAGDKELQETTDFVDTGFFDVFRLPFKYGNAATALKDKFWVVLSEEIAQQFFGNKNPVGSIMTADDTMQLTVTGVLSHVPANNTLRPAVLLPIKILEGDPDFQRNANWYNTFASGYLRLRKNADPEKVNVQLASIVKSNYDNEQKGNRVFLAPYSKISQEQSGVMGVIMKGAIGAGIFILLVILLNLVNLNTAGMYNRTKEIAVRQMIGGRKQNIILQFCIENALVVFISIVFAWLLFRLVLLPQLNELIGTDIGEIESGISANYVFIFIFAVIGILFTIAAASLPALRLSSLRVTDAVKGKMANSQLKNSLLRNLFITLQFTLATTLIIVALIFNRQMHFMKTSSLGFNKQDVAVVNLDLAYLNPESPESRFQSLINEIRNNPHVRSFSVNDNVPTAFYENFNNYFDPATGRKILLRHQPADEGFVPTFQIKMIQGRNFNDRLASAEKNSVLINRAAMEAFGWRDAVGKVIREGGADGHAYTIIGVMENFHYDDLQKPIEPLLQWYGEKPGLTSRFLSVRADAGHMKDVMQQLATAFKSIPSKRAFSFEMMADRVSKQYALLDGVLKITNYIALLTLLIASMGMFGLISIFAQQRTKEIGIRKVLGASSASIVTLLSKNFLRLVAIALVIAAPVGWYIMDHWLRDFAYRVSVSGWVYVMAGAIAVTIAFATIGVQVIRASLSNPVKSLRNE